ncbi:serine hydrolase domain-containing protein [Pedobacter caeni]|uniref:CubicO group peptidase, beta-lactamase class C family n=1 Tax=Pedobacter caeni TaxID=288992 RepID=A0A1M5JFA5_9SPHI|nr:serine hydrolase domain-containing protein [Pedobacter caeni]SHG38959.1 CubicO group peptidase, beta-lactamase class C family [Pedobacter caeni]
MNLLKLMCCGLLMSLLCPAMGFGQGQTEKDAADIPVQENRAAVTSWLKANKIPGVAIGVIRDGVLKEINVYGELKKGVPAPYNAIYNVASITKTVTAVLTLKLVDQGKWDLDEPLYKYWTDPDVKDDPKSKRLTTRHILSHQTGFPNWRFNNKSGKLAFEFEPGTKYQYSGEGMEYLRRALESKLKLPFEKLVDSLIFKPLGMTDSHLSWNGDIDESRFAVPHDENGKELSINKNKEANAADLMTVTIKDYAIFLTSLMKGELLPAKVFDQMVTPQVKVKNGCQMSLGWVVYDQLSTGINGVSHGGSDPGARALAIIFPKSKDGLLFFTNSDNGTKSYPGIIREYLKEKGQEIIDIEMKKRP